jgi:hypothetical protein
LAVGEVDFLDKIPAADGVHLYKFSANDDGNVVIAYTEKSAQTVSVPFAFTAIHDLCGEEQQASDGRVNLTGEPLLITLGNGSHL